MLMLTAWRSKRTLSLDGRWDRDGELELCMETSDGDWSFYLTPAQTEQMRDHLTGMLATHRPAAPEVKP
jgi:hypothetical protein